MTNSTKKRPISQNAHTHTQATTTTTMQRCRRFFTMKTITTTTLKQKQQQERKRERERDLCANCQPTWVYVRAGGPCTAPPRAKTSSYLRHPKCPRWHTPGDVRRVSTFRRDSIPVAPSPAHLVRSQTNFDRVGVGGRRCNDPTWCGGTPIRSDRPTDPVHACSHACNEDDHESKSMGDKQAHVPCTCTGVRWNAHGPTYRDQTRTPAPVMQNEFEKR